MNSKFICCLLMLVLSCVMNVAEGSLVLSNTLGDNMVLQRQPLKSLLWGWDAPGSKIVVSVGSKMYNSTTGSDSKFFVELSEPAGGPHDIVIKSTSGDVAKLSNVLFGDVFLCGGQSNMQFAVAGVFNATEEIAAADKYPSVRLFSVGTHNLSYTPFEQLGIVDLKWSVASSSTIGRNGAFGYFSAVCWFFGKNLVDKDKSVPIGLVSSNWGGTMVQAWSTPDAIAKCPTPVAYDVSGDRQLIGDVPTNPNTNSVLYNAMIAPFLNTYFSAVLWYQAEQNAAQNGGSTNYKCHFPAMITDWRQKFVYHDFPFLFVQLAPYTQAQDVPEMRQAQLAATTLPNVYFATAADLGDASSPEGNIHPRNKQEVGRRLALVAESLVYKRPSVYKGPMIAKATILSKGTNVTILIGFQSDTISGGLVLNKAASCPVDAAYCSLLEIKTSDGKTLPGVGSINGNTFVISASAAADTTVTSVSYAYAPWPICTLYNGAGLPAIPFLYTF